MAKSEEYRGNVLKEYREQLNGGKGYTREKFIAQMIDSKRLDEEREIKWSEDVLNKLERGEKLFVDEYLFDLEVVGIIKPLDVDGKPDRWYERLHAAKARKPKDTVSSSSTRPIVIIQIFIVGSGSLFLCSAISFVGDLGEMYGGGGGQSGSTGLAALIEIILSVPPLVWLVVSGLSLALTLYLLRRLVKRRNSP